MSKDEQMVQAVCTNCGAKGWTMAKDYGDTVVRISAPNCQKCTSAGPRHVIVDHPAGDNMVEYL